MNKKERVLTALKNGGLENDTIDALIAFAYYMGREESAREICDNVRKQADEQRERAKKCRYHKMAQDIVGQVDTYSPDYRQDCIKQFGSDETKY